MTLARYEVDDPTFVADLNASDRLVWTAARWLRSKGRTVAIPPLRVRPSVERMGDYADDGDLYLVRLAPLRLDRVEVKGRRLAFTSRADFPFPTIIVDVAHAWQKADPKPVAYLLFNAGATHLGIVTAETSRQWIRTTKVDAGKHRARHFYECPIELVTFVRLWPTGAVKPPSS